MTGVRRLALLWLPVVGLAAGLGWVLVPSASAGAASRPAAAGAPPAAAPASAGGAPAGAGGAGGGAIPDPRGAGGVPASVLFAQDCASCHGSDGRGTARAQSLAGVGEADVDFQLSTGRMPMKDASGRPPPYKAILPPADIRALDQYVTALVAKGGPAIPDVNPVGADVSHGKELWNEECAACHGWGGAGGILFDRSIPEVAVATPRQLGEAIRVGPDQMPKFGPHVISASEVNDIAAYLKSMEHPYDKGGNGLSHLGPVAEGAVTWLIVMVGLVFVTRWIGKRG